MRPAALAALAVEIAKQEAVTVKPGAPQGNQNAVKGDKTIRGNDTDCLDRNDRNQQSGLLRRLAKQGRDDLLDRVASGELRKDFTPTERVAIAKAIEEEIKAQGERRGRPSKKVVERPQLDGDKTRAIAAEKAGFGSEVTYRRAKKALDLEPVVVRPQVKGDKTRAIAAEKAGFGSEVAIAKAIEEEISRGHGGDRKSGGNQVVNRPLEKKSREVAAEKAGFGSEVTYRRAKAIEEEIKAQGERRGNPAFTSIPVDRPELDGNETRANAAEKAGFGTVVAVVENHTPKAGMTFAVELNSVH